MGRIDAVEFGWKKIPQNGWELNPWSEYIFYPLCYSLLQRLQSLLSVKQKIDPATLIFLLLKEPLQIML